MTGCCGWQVAVLLLAMVAASQAAPLTYVRSLGLGSHLGYAGYAGLASPLAYTGLASPLVYSAPKVTNIEVETPVITKANLNVLTDEDEISTTEVRCPDNDRANLKIILLSQLILLAKKLSAQNREQCLLVYFPHEIVLISRVLVTNL